MNFDAYGPSSEGQALLDALKDKPVRDTRSGLLGVLVDVIGSTAYARMPSALEWRAPIGHIEAVELSERTPHPCKAIGHRRDHPGPR